MESVLNVVVSDILVMFKIGSTKNNLCSFRDYLIMDVTWMSLRGFPENQLPKLCIEYKFMNQIGEVWKRGRNLN